MPLEIGNKLYQVTGILIKNINDNIRYPIRKNIFQKN